MPSISTRSVIVSRALAKAGRSAELRSSANEWLNDLLKHWALSYKFKELLKIGDPQTLSAGQITAAFPTEMGAGCEKILFGNENVPIYEQDLDDFADTRSFPASTVGGGRPSRYYIDKAGGVFRFNVTADQSYPFIPVYYRLPSDLATDASGDNTVIWLENEKLAVEGLIGEIYQYTGDMREDKQDAKVEKLIAQYQRGTMPMMGGSSRLKLARGRFV